MCWGLSESNIIQPTLLLCPCRVSKHVSLAMGYCEYSVVAESSNEWEAYSGTQSRRNFGRLKATLGDFSLFCPKLRAILGNLRRFWATLGDFGRF